MFLIMPEPIQEHDYFLFSDMKLYPATYMYFIGEKVILIILGFVVVTEESEYREALKVFVYLLIADLVDFLLCYNEAWFTIGSFPVSMNVVKCIVFGLTILYTWVKGQIGR